MSPLYYKQIINNPSATITKKKKYNNKRNPREKMIRAKSQNTVENTALIQRLINVISATLKNNKKFTFHKRILNRLNWQPWIKNNNKKKSTSFVNYLTGVKEKKKDQNFQSLPLMLRYDVKLDAGISDIHTASTELMSVTDEESF